MSFRAQTKSTTTADVFCLAYVFVASVLFCACLVIGHSYWQAHVESLSFEGKLPAAASPVYLGAQPEAVICSINSMECVMGNNLFATKEWTWTPHPAAVEADKLRKLREDQEREAIESGIVSDPFAEAREQMARENFSEAEMFAMMNMSDNVRHQQIWHHARREIFSGPPFTLGTILNLRDRGFAEKSEKTSLHRLEIGTHFLAEVIANELVRRHRIHVPIIHHTRGAIAKSVNYSCTCGYTRALVAGSRMQEKAWNAHGRHMAALEAVEGIADALSIAPSQEG